MPVPPVYVTDKRPARGGLEVSVSLRSVSKCQ
jgi:hypothetical protein